MLFLFILKVGVIMSFSGANRVLVTKISLGVSMLLKFFALEEAMISSLTAYLKSASAARVFRSVDLPLALAQA